jgi:hypothetical protein
MGRDVWEDPGQDGLARYGETSRGVEKGVKKS